MSFLEEARTAKIVEQHFRSSGEASYRHGDQRLVPRAILVQHGVEAAKAWYAGWDAANLAAPVPGLDDDGCPRCGSNELEGLTGVSAGCEWSQTRCEACEHVWGDGLPDEAERPLPEGFADCGYCNGAGGLGYGQDCGACAGRGIVRVPT